MLVSGKVQDKFSHLAKLYAVLFAILFAVLLYVKVPAHKFVSKGPVSTYEFDTRKFSVEALKKNTKYKGKVLINAPLIQQLPELPRGCEVTSLAMMLQYAGVPVGKMDLAAQVKKVPYKHSVNGVVLSGNPHKGFVGDIYGKQAGYGVYVEPIKELAEKYLPNRIVDLTGKSFNAVLGELDDSRPVWVIINAKYKKLPASEFQTWETTNGKIRITFRLHSVLITGYDDQFIYVNDPLSRQTNKRVPINNFKEAWIQMGSQAITFKN